MTAADFHDDAVLDADGNVIPCLPPAAGLADHCTHWQLGNGPCCWCDDDGAEDDDGLFCPARVDDEEDA